MQHTFDRIKDTPDLRDHLAAPRSIVLPSVADLSPWLGPVKDQGQLGSCTANAGMGLREFLYRKLTNYEFDKSVQPKALQLSALFQYQVERIVEGDFGTDNGAQSRTIFVAMAKYGCLLESADPYVTRNAETLLDMDPQHLQDAAKYRHISYHRAMDIETVKSILASGYVCTVGTPVFESLESTDVANTGQVPVPTPTDSCLGGHEMLIYGYNDAMRSFSVRNSWGASWGKNGNCFIPYAYFTSLAVANQGGADFWTAHLGKPWV